VSATVHIEELRWLVKAAARGYDEKSDNVQDVSPHCSEPTDCPCLSKCTEADSDGTTPEDCLARLSAHFGLEVQQ
jgi:hypothetical protein